MEEAPLLRNTQEGFLQFSWVNGKQGNDWVATLSVWLSGISAFIYFCTSYAVRNHGLFLIRNLQKTIAILK